VNDTWIARAGHDGLRLIGHHRALTVRHGPAATVRAKAV
jgi:hypothetical protein